ncbi:Uncharacterised protein [Vibrio cholerae]|uniref:Uncharacterized protein n=1 Tax=Vibrio cholerae TaxID=666 RepID=A0A655W5K8_VIBCL|nr:Uncharacterised protein [Vibrio cholerae]
MVLKHSSSSGAHSCSMFLTRRSTSLGKSSAIALPLVSMIPCCGQKPISLSALSFIATWVATSSESRLKHSPVTELAIGPSRTIEPKSSIRLMPSTSIRRMRPLWQ